MSGNWHNCHQQVSSVGKRAVGVLKVITLLHFPHKTYSFNDQESGFVRPEDIISLNRGTPSAQFKVLSSKRAPGY